MCCWPVFLTLFFCGFVFFARKKAWAVDEIPMDLVSSYNSSRGDINIITKSLHHHSNLQTMIDLSCPSRAVHSDLLGSISAVHFAISVGPSRLSILILWPPISPLTGLKCSCIFSQRLTLWKSPCKYMWVPPEIPSGTLFLYYLLADREDHNGQDVPSIELFDPCSSFEFGIWIRVLVLPVLMSMM